jgi:UDP-2-acetamido-3-amino-2,3-dideoxy-glucuronate N-acetyltransferase
MFMQVIKNIWNRNEISKFAKIGNGTKVWSYSKIRENVIIGDNVTVGMYVYIGPGVKIGNSVKIQNNSLIYEPAIIEDGVFIGPNVVLTNDKNPRAVNVDGTKKNESDWEKAGALIKQGASIGASAVIVAPITVGSWSMVSAGAVVVKDVPDYALVAGVPAQKIGWVGKTGFKLEPKGQNGYICPITSDTYTEVNPLQLVKDLN